jgi:hypothetical protein
MVHEAVWEQAWRGRRKSYHGKVPGQEILCIGCLEDRLGRRLTSADFIDAPCNSPKWGISERMRDRLAGFHLSPEQQETLEALLGENG